MAKKSNKNITVDPKATAPISEDIPAVDPSQESSPVVAPIVEAPIAEPIVETIVAPEVVEAPTRMPTLMFHESFWCPRLNKSIDKGAYVPADAIELEILAPMAVKTIVHHMTVTKK